MGRRIMEQLQRDQEFLQAAQANLEAETKEMVKLSDRLHDNLVKAMRLMWRQLLFIWAVVIILFVAYFLIHERPSPSNLASTSTKPSEASGTTQEITASHQVPPTQQSVKPVPIPEWEEVTGILEQVRAAQLKKDINLLLNAYSPKFPDIDKKKASILKTWQQYDYLDMQFRVENIQKPDAHTIMAKVAWDITLEDVHSKKKSNLLKEYTIHFSDDSGKWLIQQLNQGTKASDVANWTG
jgi:hypothetical protein